MEDNPETIFWEGWALPSSGQQRALTVPAWVTIRSCAASTLPAASSRHASPLKAREALIQNLQQELSAEKARLLQLSRTQHHEQDAALLLSDELEKLLQAKSELTAEHSRLERENRLLWVERVLICELLGQTAEEGNLCGVLAQRLHRADDLKRQLTTEMAACQRLHLQLQEAVQQMAKHHQGVDTTALKGMGDASYCHGISQPQGNSPGVCSCCSSTHSQVASMTLAHHALAVAAGTTATALPPPTGSQTRSEQQWTAHEPQSPRTSQHDTVPTCSASLQSQHVHTCSSPDQFVSLLQLRHVNAPGTAPASNSSSPLSGRYHSQDSSSSCWLQPSVVRGSPHPSYQQTLAEQLDNIPDCHSMDSSKVMGVQGMSKAISSSSLRVCPAAATPA